MVVSVTEDIDDFALMSPCTFCGVGAGEWCVTRPTRSVAQFLHGDRTRPIYKAYWLGLEEEKNNLLDSYWNNFTWFVGFAEKWANQKARVNA